LWTGFSLYNGSTVKNTIILGLVGALAGVVLASLIVPPALSWYTEPGGLPGGAGLQALVNVPDVIRYANSRLMRAQIIGGTIGAALGLTVGIVFAARRQKPAAV
jgi:hypothetical protein